MSNSTDEYLTTKQVAGLLQYHPTTIWKLIQQGKLPCVRIGRRGIRVSRKDLDTFIASHSTSTKKSS